MVLVEAKYRDFTYHLNDPRTATSIFMSAGVSVVIAIALLLPFSRRLANLFASIQLAIGITGLAIMGWFFVQGVVNPATAPLVGGIMFSALLYLKPKLMMIKKKAKKERKVQQ